MTVALCWFLFFPSMAKAMELGVVADETFADLEKALRARANPVFLHDLDPSRVCAYEKLLILGPEAFLKVRELSCPNQKRYVFGILYPSLFDISFKDMAFLSPLPSCKTLKRLHPAWTVIHSPYLAYYVDYLSACLRLKAYAVKSAFDLPEALKKAQKDAQKGYWLLILPDPVFLLGEGKNYLVRFLKKNHLKGLDLLGFEEIPLPKLKRKPAELAQRILRIVKTEERGCFFISRRGPELIFYEPGCYLLAQKGKGDLFLTADPF